MNFSLHDDHFCNLPIFHINFIKNAGNNGGINMGCLQVIDVTEYGAFLDLNDLVYDNLSCLIDSDGRLDCPRLIWTDLR